jgi:hypothetical protein
MPVSPHEARFREFLLPPPGARGRLAMPRAVLLEEDTMRHPSKVYGVDRTGRVLRRPSPEGALASTLLPVGTTAVELTADSGISRRKLVIRNAKETGDEVVIYIGDSNVSTSTGYPLYRRDEIELDVNADAGVYAIAGAPGGVVHIMEIE